MHCSIVPLYPSGRKRLNTMAPGGELPGMPLFRAQFFFFLSRVHFKAAPAWTSATSSCDLLGFCPVRIGSAGFRARAVPMAGSKPRCLYHSIPSKPILRVTGFKWDLEEIQLFSLSVLPGSSYQRVAHALHVPYGHYESQLQHRRQGQGCHPMSPHCLVAWAVQFHSKPLPCPL